MKKRSILTMVFAGLAVLALGGCCCGKSDRSGEIRSSACCCKDGKACCKSGKACEEKKASPCFSKRVREEVVAVKTTAPVVLDGKLDEADWKNAPAYTMVHAGGQYDGADWDVQEFFAKGVVEPGKLRVLWDDKYLYVGVEFTDRDLYAEAKEDQQHSYKTGDVAEIFLKPVNKRWYWELYVTPLGNKTAFYYPGRGTLGLPSGFPDKLPLKGLKSAAFAVGTVNDPSDQDVKWTAEMAIPRDEICRDTKLAPDVPWLIFFGRYNYGKDLEVKENSCFPYQPALNYHNHAGYAALKMVEKAK